MEKTRTIRMDTVRGIDVAFSVDDAGDVTVERFEGIDSKYLEAVMGEVIPPWAIEAIKNGK